MTGAMKEASALDARLRVVERLLREVLVRTGMSPAEIADIEMQRLISYARETGDHGPVMELMQKRGLTA